MFQHTLRGEEKTTICHLLKRLMIHTSRHIFEVYEGNTTIVRMEAILTKTESMMYSYLSLSSQSTTAVTVVFKIASNFI